MSGRLLIQRFVVAVLTVALLSGSSGPVAASQPGSDLEMLEQFWLDTYSEAEAQVTGLAELPSTDSPGAGLPVEPFATLNRRLLAKAQPDECYDGIGNPYPPGPPCLTGKPKVNQAYVWGLAKTGHNLWFGTAPNVHCLVFGAYLGATLPHETDSWVCEFGDSQYSPPLPASVGDWRPPRLYLYDGTQRALAEITPAADPLFRATLGIRSAGALGDVVLFGGPGLQGGINLFAFRADGSYLGSVNLPQYNNIRKWLVVKDVLYTAVGDTGGGGTVLRWLSDPSQAGYPFAFEVVGELDSAGAELAYHENRLFVTTWPSGEIQSDTPVIAGLWMSPKIPSKGLTSSQSGGWQKVWQVSAYEPDPVTAVTYGGGALASFNGYLYWGTMHVPFLAGLAHLEVYGTPAEPEDVLAMFLGSHRSISIFRGRNFGGPGSQVELVYGLPVLPVYTGGSWTLAPNNMGALPLWGPSGFGNFFNNYTWTMSVYRGQLYVGTMDWSYLLKEGLVALLRNLGYDLPEIDVDLPEQFYGADLFRFPSTASPALPESLSGVGNHTSYGIRTMLSSKEGLVLGMANPMNLLTDPNDDVPEGGWELILLR